jgi:hypothetical protein
MYDWNFHIYAIRYIAIFRMLGGNDINVYMKSRKHIFTKKLMFFL